MVDNLSLETETRLLGNVGIYFVSKFCRPRFGMFVCCRICLHFSANSLHSSVIYWPKLSNSYYRRLINIIFI